MHVVDFKKPFSTVLILNLFYEVQVRITANENLIILKSKSFTIVFISSILTLCVTLASIDKFKLKNISVHMDGS